MMRHVRRELQSELLAAGRRRELYWFRDQQGLEVDFLMPLPSGGLRMVEVKATRTPTPQMAGPMQRLAASWRNRPRPAGALEMYLVHMPNRAGIATNALAPGVRALDWREFVEATLA